MLDQHQPFKNVESRESDEKHEDELDERPSELQIARIAREQIEKKRKPDADQGGKNQQTKQQHLL